MDDEEYAANEAAAALEGETLSQWVRSSLRQARQSRPIVDTARKLAAIRNAIGLDHPTADIEQMLAESSPDYA